MNIVKSQAIKITIFTTVFALVAILIIIGFLVYSFSNSFSALSGISKYDNKIYTIESADGKVGGFIGTKVVSCGEFPSDVCLRVYYNFNVKDQLPTGKYGVGFNATMNQASLEPVNCFIDNSKINPLSTYDKNTLTSLCKDGTTETIVGNFFASFQDYIQGNTPPDRFLNINTVKIYAISSNLIETYDVAVRPIN